MILHYQNTAAIAEGCIFKRLLGISKIYPGHIFMPLKRATLLKGVRSGYQLTRMPGQITARWFYRRNHHCLTAVSDGLWEHARYQGDRAAICVLAIE